MKGYVLSEGKFRKVRYVPRGRPVLHSAEEWHQRVASINRDGMPLWFVMNPLMVYIIWFTLEAFFQMGLMHAFISATVYWVFYTLMTYAMESYQASREVERGNHSGLFEHGIQVRLAGTHVFHFIPYSDIIDFRVKVGWFFQTLVLECRGKKRPFKIGNMPEILGVVGLEELRRRVDASAGRFEMPRLVLYGDGKPVVATASPLVDPEARSPVFTAGLRF